MIERRIKELSIALEALSRINGERTTVFAEAIGDLLQDAINEARLTASAATPVNPAPPRYPSNSADDEIPF